MVRNDVRGSKKLRRRTKCSTKAKVPEPNDNQRYLTPVPKKHKPVVWRARFVPKPVTADELSNHLSVGVTIQGLRRLSQVFRGDNVVEDLSVMVRQELNLLWLADLIPDPNVTLNYHFIDDSPVPAGTLIAEALQWSEDQVNLELLCQLGV